MPRQALALPRQLGEALVLAELKHALRLEGVRFDAAHGDDDFDTAQQVYDCMKALLAHCRALVETLKAIAAPDDLLEANEGAFNIHAARRMQAIATEALKGITDAA